MTYVPAVLLDAHVAMIARRRSRCSLARAAGIRVRRVGDVPTSTRDLVRWGETLDRHCQDRPRVHQEPLRAGTLRRDPQGRRHIHAAAASTLAHDGQPVAKSGADDLVLEWMQDVRQGVAGYVTPKVAVGAIVGHRHPGRPSLRAARSHRRRVRAAGYPPARRQLRPPGDRGHLRQHRRNLARSRARAARRPG